MSLRSQYLSALGIDEWRSRVPAQHTRTQPMPSAAPMPAPATALEAPVVVSVPDTARKIADNTDAPLDWDALAARVRDCRQCSLCETRTHTVFGVGERRAQLMVVGEAPGADEDKAGEPFVGRAGQLLNSMLRAMGQPRESVYIANILKCRPPGNRDPAPAEVSECIGYLRRQVELVAPRLIMAVGRIAAQNLLATDTPIGKMRGVIHRFEPSGTPVIVTYHPAYLLRSPGEKRKAWVDLKLARAQLRQA